MKTRSILIVNDDGIQAEGILRLAQAAKLWRGVGSGTGQSAQRHVPQYSLFESG